MNARSFSRHERLDSVKAAWANARIKTFGVTSAQAITNFVRRPGRHWMRLALNVSAWGPHYHPNMSLCHDI